MCTAAAAHGMWKAWDVESGWHTALAHVRAPSPPHNHPSGRPAGLHALVRLPRRFKVNKFKIRKQQPPMPPQGQNLRSCAPETAQCRMLPPADFRSGLTPSYHVVWDMHVLTGDSFWRYRTNTFTGRASRMAAEAILMSNSMSKTEDNVCEQDDCSD